MFICAVGVGPASIHHLMSVRAYKCMDAGCTNPIVCRGPGFVCPTGLLLFFVLRGDCVGTPLATGDHSAVIPNDNGATYYRVLSLLERHGAAYGLMQPVGVCIHELSKYVFCGTPSGDL